MTQQTRKKKSQIIAENTGRSPALVDVLLHSVNHVLDRNAIMQGRAESKHRMDAVALLDILKSCPDLAPDLIRPLT